MSKKKEPELKVTQVPTSIEEAKSTLNPYLPAFMAKKPWYLTEDHETLKPKEAKERDPKELEQWYPRGQKAGKATKYRKGACTNCGAITHQVKECVERPRKKGAKWTNEDIKEDEIIGSVKLDFDGKRDRWNGYDPQEYMSLVENWKVVEEKREKIREQKRMEKLQKRLEAGKELSSSESDDDKYADEVDAIGQSVHMTTTKEKFTRRNLRIREDTAKYLRNLDPSSAPYDPKTRAMRENPYGNEKAAGYKGDDFERYTGQVKMSTQMNDFVWDASTERAPQLTTHSNPTLGELMFKKMNEESTNKIKIPKGVLEKYGGQEHLAGSELLFAQTEEYVEYTPSGDLVKGQPKESVKSKYPEDIYNGNHTSVWGSYWHMGEWGYKCCHSKIKQSYCGGIAAIEADTYSKLKKPAKQVKPEPPKTLQELHLEKLKSSKKSTPESGLDPEKLQKALQQTSDEINTAEDLEAYHLKKIHKNDPMAAYLGKKK